MLKHFPAAGGSDLEFDFGDAAGTPVVGDWNGNSVDSVGRFSGGTWSLKNALEAGPADYTFSFGAPNALPVIWGRIS
jgi:hypothetical protein